MGIGPSDPPEMTLAAPRASAPKKGPTFGCPSGTIGAPVATEVSIKDRTLPHNAEAERTVLGAILVDNAAFNSAAEILTRDDFHREAHRRIYEAMAILAEKSQPVDLVTLKDELARGAAL